MSELGLAKGPRRAAPRFTHALAVLVSFVCGRKGGRPRAAMRYRLRSRRQSFESRQGEGRDLADVGEQLHAVMAASFEKRRVMNRAEYRAFKIIEDYVTARAGYRVFAQTNLGEILCSSDADAFRSINSKRVDILVVDPGGWPVLAAEYQGSGHYQGTAAARDAIKKEALRKAGVPYVEILADDSDDQIRSRVRERLGWKSAA
jgi:hypothetical protein